MSMRAAPSPTALSPRVERSDLLQARPAEACRGASHDGEADLEKAHLILSEFGLLIGPAGAMSDVIAREVAAGIALGRKEAQTKARGGNKSKSL